MSNWFYQELLYIKSQLHFLTQQIQQLHQTRVNEYIIDDIKLDKVSGSFQIGKSVKESNNVKHGVHRFYIKKVDINEIQGSGSVGIGVSVQGKKMKQKGYPKITMKEASGKIKEIYQEIQNTWQVDHIPLLIQRLAIHEPLLVKCWEVIKTEISPREDYQLLVQQIKDQLFQSLHHALKSVQTVNCSDLNQDFIDVFKSENHAWVSSLYLLKKWLPGYFAILQYKSNHVTNHDESELESDPSFLTMLKNKYNLKELPKPFEKTDEKVSAPSVKDQILPFIQTNKDEQILSDIKGFALEKIDTSKVIFQPLNEFTLENEIQLHSLFMWNAQTSPYYLFLSAIFSILIQEDVT